jgi:hypothetical protein
MFETFPGRERASRLPAAVLTVCLPLSSCAHVSEGREPLALTERAIREACVPFVVDAIDGDEVGRRLGGWWTRNLPDPFTPPQGPIFRRDGATLQVIDGRSARTAGGALTTQPRRTCTLWLGQSMDEGALVAAVRAAAASRTDAILADPPVVDGRRRVVACVPSGPGRTAVVSALVFPNGEAGANVHETSAGARPGRCLG